MNYTATARKTIPAPKKIKSITREEEMKRQTVFAKIRTIVLVKILGVDPLPGILEKTRDEFAIEFNNTAEAFARNLDPEAYHRPKSDTGFCLFEKEPLIRITNIVEQLQSLGLHYIGGHYQTVEGEKKPVQTFQFSSVGKEIPIPKNVKEQFACRFSEVSVWCNLKINKTGPGQFRLDTINLNGPHASNKPARELVIQGNTYRLNH